MSHAQRQQPVQTFRHALLRQDLLPSVRLALWAAALFALGLLLARMFAEPIRAVLTARAGLGVLVFVASSAFAVLMPLASNLPLMPVAVLAWGPWWAALLLLAGWILGSALSFALGRHAQRWVSQRLPSVLRHSAIERLIDPRHRITSLILLRMTFPVDVLSYALGLFSRDTTLAQTVLSTAIGGAPFALLFALLPALPPAAQAAVFAACTALFVAWAWWVPRDGIKRR